jgi:bifunctional non-homologous end joining protein LigD
MLEEYKKKRHEDKTPEPPPREAGSREGPLIFVVHKHAASSLHYDLRLEWDGVLKSWALPKGPSTNPEKKHLAVMVEDHPFDYHSFEGVVPEGEYGAGQVIIWDQGTYSPDEGGELSFNDRDEAEQRMRQGVKEGKLSFYLRGQKLKGSWTLVKMRGRGENNWLLIKHRDEFAGSNDILKQDVSVVSDKTIEDLKKESGGGYGGSWG